MCYYPVTLWDAEFSRKEAMSAWISSIAWQIWLQILLHGAGNIWDISLGNTYNYLTSSYPHHDIYRFVTGKSSGILSDISSGIRSCILSGISHGILSGISSGILSDILSGISSGILSGRWGPTVHTELGRLRTSSAHWAGKVPGWGPAVHTELGRSQVEVQRCPLSWEGPRLRSSGAHWAGKVPGWGPAVHTELGRSLVEVQQCTLEKLEEEEEAEEEEDDEEEEDEEEEDNSSDKIQQPSPGRRGKTKHESDLEIQSDVNPCKSAERGWTVEHGPR